MKNAKLIFISLGLLIASFNANAATCATGSNAYWYCQYSTLSLQLGGNWTYSSGGVTFYLNATPSGNGGPNLSQVTISDSLGNFGYYTASLSSGYTNGSSFYTISFSAAGASISLTKNGSSKTICVNGTCQPN